jgi:antitoxin (DNA-binding transcriptional repressor) of toxin-antitoxin stability system
MDEAAELRGLVEAAGGPVAGAEVAVTDEGRPVAVVTTGPDGRFVVPGLPAGHSLTVRAVDAIYGAATTVARPPQDLQLTLSPGACQSYVDLSEPRWLVPEGFLQSWGAEPLTPTCPTCPAYRWFWERPGLTPVVLRLDFGPDGVVSTVRARSEDGWDEHTTVLSARRALRMDRAIGHSGYWQLEHASTGSGCDPQGTEWTVEATASVGYRAVYRVDPLGTPIALLGREWVRAARLRVRRRDFR